MTAWNDPPLSRGEKIAWEIIGWALILIAGGVVLVFIGFAIDGALIRPVGNH